MKTFLVLAEKYALSDSPVLLLGESGSGKETLAFWMHKHSRRSNGPFKVLNCAALPESLAESELFGYEKGAFSDAYQDKMGLFEQAEGGSLYLDEVGELSLAVQAKILRLVSSGELTKLGSEKTKNIDVRILSSASQFLEEKVESGNFRSDLFFRLGVFLLNIPPLRSRLEDIVPLVESFFSFYQEKYQKTKMELPAFLWKDILSHSWPGNIRELKNWAERCVILNQPLKPGFSQTGEILNPNLRQAVDIFKKEYILKILEKHRGNKTRASKELGVQRTYLIKICKEMGEES